MKIYGIAMLAILVMSVFAGIVVAEDVEVPEELEGDPGITPDSMWHGLDRAMERIALGFTFNKVRKAERRLEIAKERVLEAREMAKEGNLEALEKAQALHDAIVAEIQADIEGLQEDSEAANVRAAIKNLVKLQSRVALHEMRLQALRDYVTENELDPEEEEKLQAVIARMEERAENMKETAEERKERIKTRLRAVTNETENEVEDEAEEIENEANLTATRKALAERWVQKAEEAMARLRQRIVEEKAQNFDVAVLEEHAIEVEMKIQAAKTKIAEEDYVGALEVIKEVNNYGRNMRVLVRKTREARMENKTAEVKELVKEANQEKLAVLSRIQERLQERQLVIDARLERIKLRIRALTNVSAGNQTQAGSQNSNAGKKSY